MESKKVLFVAQLTLVSLFIEEVTNNHNALRIQVCPKKGFPLKSYSGDEINPTLGRGSGFLGTGR